MDISACQGGAVASLVQAVKMDFQAIKSWQINCCVGPLIGPLVVRGTGNITSRFGTSGKETILSQGKILEEVFFRAEKQTS